MFIAIESARFQETQGGMERGSLLFIHGSQDTVLGLLGTANPVKRRQKF